MIPLKIRKQLEKDPRMKKCLACGVQGTEWHHALQHKGKSLQEAYSIQPLCTKCHRGNSGKPDKYAKAISELVAITMGLKHLQEHYPKTDWLQRKKYLESLIIQL